MSDVPNARLTEMILYTEMNEARGGFVKGLGMIKDNNLVKVNNRRFEMKGKKVVKGQKKQNNKSQSKRLKTFNSS